MKIYGDPGTFRSKSRLGTPRTGLGVRQAPAVIARSTPLQPVPVRMAPVSTVRPSASGATRRDSSERQQQRPRRTLKAGDVQA